MPEKLMRCPACHNSLAVPDDVNRFWCSQCDAELTVEKGTGYVTLREADYSIPESVPKQPGNKSIGRKITQSLFLVVLAVMLLCIFSAVAIVLIGSRGNDDNSRSIAEIDSDTAVSEGKSTANTASTKTVATKEATATVWQTRTPRSTSAPTERPIIWVTVLNTANLRAGPGVNFEVVDSVEGGEQLAIVGRNNDGTWLKVDHQESVWIWVQLVDSPVEIDEIPVPPTATPTITPTPTPSPNSTETKQAENQRATSTARAQARINATATILAWSHSPPVGSWCDYNSTRVVCVGNFEYRRSVGYTSAHPTARFIVFTVRVDNRSTSSITVNPFDVTLVLEDGTTYAHSTETYSYSNYLDGVNVAPGNNTYGAVVFYVKNDMAPKTVIYSGGLFESEILVDLPEDLNE